MILEVQIQRKCTQRALAHARQSFHFQKFQIFFCENWYEASFYNNKQTQKYKLEI